MFSTHTGHWSSALISQQQKVIDLVLDSSLSLAVSLVLTSSFDLSSHDSVYYPPHFDKVFLLSIHDGEYTLILGKLDPTWTLQ
jgi:hypothetical protein